MTILDPPPTGNTWNFLPFKDWFYKLWKSVRGMTFGADASSYSNAINSLSSLGDGSAYRLTGREITTASFFQAESSHSVVSLPAANTNYSVSILITPTVQGSVLITGGVNFTTSSATTTLNLQSNGTTLVTESTGQTCMALTTSEVLFSGVSYTISTQVAVGGTAPAGAFGFYIGFIFVPNS